MRLTDKKKVEYANELIKLSDKLCDDNFYQLAKLGQLEDIEDDVGLPLKVWVYLVKKWFIADERIYVENTFDDEEKRKFTKEINGREQRFLIDIDFDNKCIYMQGTEDWTKQPFNKYGKTWALTKEELL